MSEALEKELEGLTAEEANSLFAVALVRELLKKASERSYQCFDMTWVLVSALRGPDCSSMKAQDLKTDWTYVIRDKVGGSGIAGAGGPVERLDLEALLSLRKAVFEEEILETSFDFCHYRRHIGTALSVLITAGEAQEKTLVNNMKTVRDSITYKKE